MAENCDRLMDVLFRRPEHEHIDVKFFVLGARADLTKEAFCASALSMVEQMHAKIDADEEFHEAFEPVEASLLIAGR